MFRSATQNLARQGLLSNALVPNARPFFTFVMQYQRGVTLTFGKLTAVKKPGFRMLVPFLQSMRRIDMRMRVKELEGQDIITKDNVAAKVSAVVYYRVRNTDEDVEAAALRVDGLDHAIAQLAQTEMRDILCQCEFSELLEKRESFAKATAANLRGPVSEWGVKLERVQMKNIDLVDANMVRALAKEAEATRERKAAIIRSDGELIAATKLVDAAQLLLGQEGAMELRRMQMVERIAKEKGQNTIIVPMDLGTVGMGLSAGAVAAAQQCKASVDHAMQEED